jgi:hypothetical protein
MNKCTTVTKVRQRWNHSGTEPNNVARALPFDSANFHDAADEILARARLQLICERSKAALNRTLP